jgi:cyclase
MLTKRIIPCLDIKNGRTVKGVKFVNIRDAGDPVSLGKAYAEQGADELVFLDITATLEDRKTFADLVKKIAEHLNIPFTVGGGIQSEEDVRRLLDAGADKISVNTAAVQNPALIDQLAQQFGSQCIVLAVDVKKETDDWRVFIHSGNTSTSYFVVDWIRQAVDRGVGEILLTSMNHDGTKNGFAIELTRRISEEIPVPVIASGGAGGESHFVDIFREGKADAALAASIFHFSEIKIPDLKKYLHEKNIAVRI